MPRSPEDQRKARKERYALYRSLCEDFNVLIQEPWDKHFQVLRAQKSLNDSMANAARFDRRQMTPEERAVVGAEFCTFCQEDCLPLPPHGVCGFCDRLPETGEFAGDASQIEEQRRRWRTNTRAYRARKRTEEAA